MNNNDVLRKIRYAFDFSDTKMIEIFELGGAQVTRAEVSSWLKQERDADLQDINNEQLATFLNGLIIDKRGRQDGVQPKPEKYLNNNIIFRKLRIALNLKDVDILDMLDKEKMFISKHELSAFFRKPSQNQYRECEDQILRNFLHSLAGKYRGK